MFDRLEHNPATIDAAAFHKTNDLCFPAEPVGRVEFEQYRSVDHWIAYNNDEMIGFAVLSHNSHSAHIRRIGVIPSMRRRGIGNRFMTLMLERAKSMGVEYVDLLVQSDNRGAIALYEAFGFTEVDQSVQFVTTLPTSGRSECTGVPVADLPTELARSLPRAAINLASHHDPPRAHVLAFIADGAVAGYARFAPDFPGCSPFVLVDQAVDVHDILSSIGEFALLGKTRLKITTDDPRTISLLAAAGVEQNYALSRMERRG